MSRKRIELLEAAIDEQEKQKKFMLDVGFTLNGVPADKLVQDIDRIIQTYRKLVEGLKGESS